MVKMMNNRCFYCYNPLGADELDFHPDCSRKFFGTQQPPELPYTQEQIKQLALKAVQSHVTVPGVQPKLSLDLKAVTNEKGIKRFTIMGFEGEYILKPPSERLHTSPGVSIAKASRRSIWKIWHSSQNE
jgi:serine/threonine-protein kinase HipA